MLRQLELLRFSKKIIKCKECGSKKLCFYNILSKQQKEIFSSFVSDTRFYTKNQYLFRVGESADYLYILKSGSAKSYLVSENGDEQITSFHFRGDILGLDDLTNHKNSSSVLIMEDSNVCMIARNSFEAMTNEIPPLQYKIISLLNKEILHAHEFQLMSNHLTAEQRLATFILELSQHMDLIGISKVSLRLSMSRSEIANYLGLATDTVSRILKMFERKRIILVKNKSIKIIDYQELINCANLCNLCSSMLLEKDCLNI